ncbi:MAG: hypothetical protein JNL74_01905 [Fibrobacteres bacterium]|nr:hypothetical protein [Fibrobacterota bacterium]
MKKIFAAVLGTIALSVSAQDAVDSLSLVKDKLVDLEGKIAALEEPFLETKGTVDKLAKFKFSGYIQAQYRMAMDTAENTDSKRVYKAPVGDFSGGKFLDGQTNEFQVRRGRLKLTYEEKMSKAVLQLDITNKGVGVKDAYLQIKEPWLKTANLTMGLFDRPFGHEISYSSSTRESPERSRLFQVLFPGERDVGAMLEIAPPEKYSVLSMLNLKAGVFNGNGIAADNNDNKDFIGRFGINIPLVEQNLSIEAGASTYMGKVVQGFDTAYVMGDDKKFKIETAANAKFETRDRNYMGADLRVFYDLPVIGGISIRGEYIQGTQPGNEKSTSVFSAAYDTEKDVKIYNDSLDVDSTVNSVKAVVPAIENKNKPLRLYEREFSGFYAMLVKNIGSKNQLVVKYDSYDPNVKVEGADFKTGTNLKASDLAYNTIGLGWIYHWDANLKFVLYYDMVSNETVDASLAADAKLGVYSKEVNDDVLTVRVQYKF